MEICQISTSSTFGINSFNGFKEHRVYGRTGRRKDNKRTNDGRPRDDNSSAVLKHELKRNYKQKGRKVHQEPHTHGGRERNEEKSTQMSRYKKKKNTNTCTCNSCSFTRITFNYRTEFQSFTEGVVVSDNDFRQAYFYPRWIKLFHTELFVLFSKGKGWGCDRVWRS